LTVSPAAQKEFTVYVRVPQWSATTTASVNGSGAGKPKPGEYFAVTRSWKPGDRLELNFDTAPKLIAANPQVIENTGKIAVQRGALVYCLEQIDQRAHLADLLFANPWKNFDAEFQKELLGGVELLKHEGAAYTQPVSSEPLYQLFGEAASRKIQPAELTLIPYYAWANREQSAMEVWIPLKPTTPPVSQSPTAKLRTPGNP
jgi:DUF1680 family protein